MKEFIGVKNLRLTPRNLKNVSFKPLSPLARRIVKRSDVFYKGGLLNSNEKSFQQTALGLAKSYFKVGAD